MEPLVAKVSKMSHSLRNALAVVYSTAQLLELHAEHSGNKDIKDTSKQLVSSIQEVEVLLAREVAELKEELSK